MNAIEQAYWQKFKAVSDIESPLFGSSWSFCATVEMADDLGQLVLEGKKTGQVLRLFSMNLKALPFQQKTKFMIFC